MNADVFEITLRRRARPTAIAAVAMAVIIVLVCALFPSLGESLGNLNLGSGASNLLGGGDFSTLPGYLSTEVFSIYGPAVVIGVGITAIVAVTAREEEDGILGLVLSLPIERSSVMLSKAAAVALTVAIVGVAIWLGVLVGVVVAGGGLGAGDSLAQVVHLTVLALSFTAFAFALAAGTGKSSLALGASAGVAGASYLVNGLAPLSDATDWMQKLSPFYYYNGNVPLSNGVDVGHLAVLLVLAVVLTVVGAIGIRRRDLRG